MKKAILNLTLVCCALIATAQFCPEYSNSVISVDEDENVVQLEIANAVLKQKKKGIYRGWDISLRLDGATSSVKLNSSTTFTFKPYDAEMRPEQQVKLYYFESNKDFRELSAGGMNMFGGSKNSKSEDTSIPITIEKLSDGCYQITIDVTLPAGEYAFSCGEKALVQGQSTGFGADAGDQSWYAFTID